MIERLVWWWYSWRNNVRLPTLRPVRDPVLRAYMLRAGRCRRLGS